MMDTLSASLKDALKKLAGKAVVDRAAVDELVKNLQRALLSSDVNVKLVMELSKAIRTRSLDEELPKKYQCPGTCPSHCLPGTGETGLCYGRSKT